MTRLVAPSKRIVTVISHPHNIGYGRSIKDGIRAATHDVIAIADGDGTYPLDRIPDLYEAYRQGFDMVIGARRGRAYGESFRKWTLRLVLKGLVQFAAGRKIADINSGLRIFSKKTVLPYFDNLCGVALVTPLRAITKRVPHRVLVSLCWTAYPLLAAYVAACRVLPLPMHRYMTGHFQRLSRSKRVLTIYDQLNPAYAKYYTRDEALDLLRSGGFTDVQAFHRHGYSWTVVGTKCG